MFINYIKIGIRNVIKYKAFSFINIFGLTIGISACMLIFTYVQNEISYDQFHSKKEHTYRLNKIVTPTTGGRELHAITSGNMGPTLTSDYPEVDQSLRLLPWFNEVLMISGDKKLKIPDAVFTDANFFEFFDFRLLQGDPGTALAKPQSIILSQETSQKFFGDKNPLGKTIVGYNNLPYQITGIIENAPARSHLRYNALISWSSTVPGVGALNMNWLNNWITQANYTYLMLTSPEAAETLQPKLTDFMQKYMPSRTEQYQLYLQPLTDIHLKSANIQYSRNLNLGNILYVYIFSATALLILFIACINFVNLSTVRATKRSREVGVRKVLGAEKWQLSAQFLGESILLCHIATIVAVLIVEWTLPIFERLTGYSFQFNMYTNPFLIALLTSIASIVGIIAGFYPSFFLSGFRPAEVLRARWKGNNRGVLSRKILVIAQFAISIILILATIVIYRQMGYIQNKNMGFQKEQIIVLPVGSTAISEKADAFKRELNQHPEILSVSASQNVPGSGSMGFNIIPEGKQESENWQAEIYPVDYEFPETYKMEMVEGRYFSREFATDANEAVIINQSLQKSLGWQNPIGKKLDISGETENSKVIGVIKDFNFESLHHAIDPLIFYIAPERTGNISIRISGHDVPSTLKFLETKWQAFESKYPFEYYFIDKEFEKFYQSEKRMMKTMGIFASVAILIACLGIFGLASFTVQQRTKEIGIRKILGAPVSNIFVLLSGDFMRLIIVALFISSPIAYYFLHKWLSSFAYRISLSWWLFVLAGILTLLIALITVSTQAVRAALENPVNSLRYE